MAVFSAVLTERYGVDNQLHRRLHQRIHHSPHLYSELGFTDTTTVLQVNYVTCSNKNVILYQTGKKYFIDAVCTIEANWKWKPASVSSAIFSKLPLVNFGRYWLRYSILKPPNNIQVMGSMHCITSSRHSYELS